MTVALIERTTTLKKGVFHSFQIEQNNSIAHLPATVLPGARLGVLLVMSWIKSVGVCLDVIKRCLLHKDQEHAYQQLLVPKV